jgi:hypothetical protein
MLLHNGEYNGARILRPETVAEMSKNNMGVSLRAEAEGDRVSPHLGL